MKRFTLLLIMGIMVFSLIFVTSCNVFDTKQLTREKAKQIIIRDCFGGKNNLPAVGILRIGQGIILFDNDSIPINKLKNAGFLTSSLSNQKHPFYNIFLTDTAKAFVVRQDKSNDPADLFDREKKITAIIKLGDLSFNDVTGIKLIKENKVAMVDFNYTYNNLTPFGEIWFEGGLNGSIMRGSERLVENALLPLSNFDVKIEFNYKKKAPDFQHAVVKMELFDDGWRVAKRKKDKFAE